MIDTKDPRKNGGEGGILTQALLPSGHVVSKLPENPMNIGCFYGLACFNYFNLSA